MRYAAALVPFIALLALACGGGGKAKPTATVAPPTLQLTATAQPAAETLAFIRDGDIWLIGADGSNERRLGLSSIESFSWITSSEIHAVEQGGQAHILVDLQGNASVLSFPLAVAVDVGPYDLYAVGAWSPGGDRYAVPIREQLVVFDSKGAELERVDMEPRDLFCAGSSSKPTIGGTLVLGSPVFSPDGRNVILGVFCGPSEAHNQYARLYQISLEAQAVQPLGLSVNLRYFSLPKLSSDASRVAQVSVDQSGLCPPTASLAVADVAGGEARELTLSEIEELRHEGSGRQPFGGPVDFDWSPAGDTVVASFDAGVCDPNADPDQQFRPVLTGLYLLKLDGSASDKLLDGPTASPAWSPAGRYIAYGVSVAGAETQEPPSIRLYDTSKRTTAELTQGSQPAWQPRP